MATSFAEIRPCQSRTRMAGRLRQIQQKIPFQGSQDAVDIHAVFNQTVDHRLANLIVVLGLGNHVLGTVTKSRTAIAAGLILPIGDLQIDDLFVGDGSHIAFMGPRSLAPLTAFRTRSLLGSTVHRNKKNRGCFGIHACVLPEFWWFKTSKRRRRSYSSNGNTLETLIRSGNRRGVSNKRGTYNSTSTRPAPPKLAEWP